jgi:hypothetical protein
VAKVCQDGPKAGGVLGSGKKGSVFGFTGTGNDAGNDGGESEDCAVDFEGLVR